MFLYNYSPGNVDNGGLEANSENPAIERFKYSISLDPNITKRGEVRDILYSFSINKYKNSCHRLMHVFGFIA